jgi:hypothetical protein
MTKIEHDAAGLIDLGNASVETKGVQTQYAPDEILQHKDRPGLSAD